MKRQVLYTIVQKLDPNGRYDYSRHPRQTAMSLEANLCYIDESSALASAEATSDAYKRRICRLGSVNRDTRGC